MSEERYLPVIASTGTGWPDSDLQAEFDAVMKEALAGRMPATRLRLAEAVVEAARAAFGTASQVEGDEAYVAALAAYDEAVKP